MRTLLIRRLAPLLALVALLASACGAVADSPAATANGKAISVDSVQNELVVIRGNKGYQAALEQSYGSKLGGVGKGTFGAPFVAQLVSLRVYYSLIEQALNRTGIKVSASEDANALKAVEQQLNGLGKDALKKFPVWYRKQLGHQEAVLEKAHSEAQTGTIADKYFAAHRDEFSQACVSHILISKDKHSLDEALAIAKFLKAQLDGGADFATLAKASSEDTGSKDSGGDLQCGAKGRFVKEFDDAVFSLPIGKVSDPVKTEFGYHLILVKSRTEAKLDDVRQDVGQKAFNAYLLDLMCGKASKVHVNPRYGSWDTSPCKGEQGLAKVDPPPAPKGETTTTSAPQPGADGSGASDGSGSAPSSAP
jgi:foldase protein PrsA